MKILVNLLISTIAVLIAAYVIPGVTVEGFFAAVVVAVILGVVNAFVRPVISLISLPINMLTLGLFSFVISALMIMLVDLIVPGFAVANFLSALLFGIVLTLVNTVLFSLAK